MVAPSPFLRSISSHLMSQLITWRNPHGEEINWYNGNDTDHDNGIPYDQTNFLFRKVATELALPILTVASVIEGFAYVILGTFANLLFLPEKWCDHIFSLGDSAFFTFFWSMANLFNNLIYTNLHTKEAFANLHLTGATHTEERYRNEWLQIHRPQIYLDVSDEYGRYTNNQKICAGGAFMVEEIVKKSLEDQDFMDAFVCYERDLYPYLLVKSFSVYISGGKKHCMFPQFFKKETISQLKEIRQEYQNNSAEHAQLLEITSSWAKFSEAQKDKEGTLIKELFNLIGPELQGLGQVGRDQFLFIGNCWQQALKHPLFKTQCMAS